MNQKFIHFLSTFSATDKLATFNAMALVAIVFYHVADWRFTIPVYCLAAAGFVFKQSAALCHWLFWTILSTIFLSYLVISWPIEGNNYYLFFYLTLTCLVGSLTQSFSVIRVNSRLLIGIIFLAAALWKLVNPSYIDGGFFRYMLLTEPRLTPITQLIFQTSDLRAIPTIHPYLFAFVVYLLTWCGIVLEFLIALYGLLPLPYARRARDLLMLIFLTVTYVLLPVPAFGMMLSCFGYGQSRTRLQPLYLLFFVMMPLTTLRTFL